MNETSSQLVSMLSRAALLLAPTQLVHFMHRCLMYSVLPRKEALEWMEISVLLKILYRLQHFFY